MYYLYLLLILLITILFSVELKKLKEIRETLIELSPLSKSELDYNPNKWNKSEDDIQKYNNCYSYATNDLQKNRYKKLHPGHISNIDTSEDDYLCPDMKKFIFMDHPNAYEIDFKTPCKCNYYKAYLSIDPKNDFHLYKQDSNGYWSHKPGSKKVTNLDASGNHISNPEIADREYNQYNYKDSCMFFCMPHKEENKKVC